MTYVHGIIDFRTYFAVVARVAYVGGSDITLKTNKISRRGIIIIVFRSFLKIIQTYFVLPRRAADASK